MSTVQLVATLITVGAGAIIGFVPSIILQRRTQSYEIKTRWDSMLLSASVDLLTAARRAEHLADQIERGQNDDERMRLFDDLHQQVRVAVEQIRILGTAEVQVAARNILRSVYSRRLLLSKGVDPYSTQYGGMLPSERLGKFLLVFYKSVRAQLRVVNAEDVPLDLNDPISGSIQEEHRGTDQGGASPSTET
jgi:hypothetical protein